MDITITLTAEEEAALTDEATKDAGKRTPEEYFIASARQAVLRPMVQRQAEAVRAGIISLVDAMPPEQQLEVVAYVRGKAGPELVAALEVAEGRVRP